MRLEGLIDATVTTSVASLPFDRSVLRHEVTYRFRGPLGGFGAAGLNAMGGAGYALRHGVLAQKRGDRGASPGVTLRSVVKGAAYAASAAVIGYVALASGRAADADLFAAVNRGHGPVADRLFAGITELGSLYGVGAAAGTLAALGRPREAGRAFAAAGATWLLGQGEAGRPATALRCRSRRHPRDDRATDGHVVAEQPSGGAHRVHDGRGARARRGSVRASRHDGAGCDGRRFPRVPGRALPQRRGERPPGGTRRRRDVASGTPRLDCRAVVHPLAQIGWPVLDRFRFGDAFAISPTACSSRSASWSAPGCSGASRRAGGRDDVQGVVFWSLIGAIVGPGSST